MTFGVHQYRHRTDIVEQSGQHCLLRINPRCRFRQYIRQGAHVPGLMPEFIHGLLQLRLPATEHFPHGEHRDQLPGRPGAQPHHRIANVAHFAIAAIQRTVAGPHKLGRHGRICGNSLADIVR